jgi:Rrf2 family protein
MKLSTRSRYGTRILIDIALHQDGGPVQVSKIAKRQDISVKYVEQLIRPLKKEKYLNSIRGPKGGYVLEMAPEQITLGQIVRLFEKQADLVECVSAPDACPMSPDCRVRLAWKDATQAMCERLDATTIADLM